METNDETFMIEDEQVITPQMRDGEDINEQSKGSWKKVAVGSVSGILLGGGALYTVDTLASDKEETSISNSQEKENIKVAKVNDGLSFDDAFASARAQIGGGGVFRWNGGIYSTYTNDEWNAMSDKEKSDFAYAVRPEVRADEIVAERIKAMTEDMHHSYEESSIHSTTHNAAVNGQENIKETSDAVSENVASNYYEQQNQDIDDNDVHVVGQGTIHGHQAVALDMTGNGAADVAIIDWNDNGRLDDPDVMIDREGNYATIGQLLQTDNEQNTDNGYVSDTGSNMQDPNMLHTSYNGCDAISDSNVDDIDDGGSIQDDGGYTAI